MIKYKLLVIIALLCIGASSARAQQDNHYFPYPEVPDNLATLTERCNYLVYNFWERCNIKQSFSSKNRLDQAFGDWIGFMPYASADTVYLAIDNYLKDVAKQSPDNLVTVGEMARKWTYSDSAEVYSEQLYLPFCQAMANGKKVPKAQKARFAAEAKMLESSGMGRRIPDFDYATPDGETKNVRDVLASRIILFFNDPDCMDCRITKARLAADFNLNQLIDHGLVKVISIYPGEATPEWCDEAKSYPESWIVGANPEIDEYFDLSEMPNLYYLDSRHKVLGKNLRLENLLLALSQINQSQQ